MIDHRVDTWYQFDVILHNHYWTMKKEQQFYRTLDGRSSNVIQLRDSTELRAQSFSELILKVLLSLLEL